MATMKEKRDEAMELFLQNNKDSRLGLEFFHTFLCPVALAEAMVREHIIEDYDALELLVLRLYNAGFRDPESLASLSGMKLAMVERALYNEVFVYSHIDSETGEITEIGRQTLKENEGDEMENHVMYLTPRRFQVEALTGTVIPTYLEEKTIHMKPFLDERFDGVIPPETVNQDEELKREINERLREYKHLDILNEGDTIRSIEKLETAQIFYRWAYLTRFEGMKFPMIAMRGYRAIDQVNIQSRKKKKFGNHVVIPISIATDDAPFLREHGIHFDGTLVRENRQFEYLYNNVGSFDLYWEESEQRNTENASEANTEDIDTGEEDE